MEVGDQVAAGGATTGHDVLHSACPAREVVDHVTSKWGVWVLVTLRERDLRFHELRQGIAGISEKMLSQTLRTLVADGLVWRHVEPTAPPRVTYGLTDFGTDISEPLADLFSRITRRLATTGR